MKPNKGDVWIKTGGKCAYCGNKISRKHTTIDHIIPKSRFEPIVKAKQMPVFLSHLTTSDVDHIDNLLPSCSTCNGKKGTMSVEKYRASISKTSFVAFYFETIDL